MSAGGARTWGWHRLDCEWAWRTDTAEPMLPTRPFRMLGRPVCRYATDIGLRLLRKAFRPAPRVDSAVLIARRV